MKLPKMADAKVAKECWLAIKFDKNFELTMHGLELAACTFFREIYKHFLGN